jgi:ABC-2 type transport system ATP-binding protein
MGGENRTVILSSHLLHEVEQVCDSVAILSHGRLIVQGDVAELLRERGQAQVRLHTTNDAKAREILNALDWVESVSADNGYLVAGVDPDRSWEITAALSRNEVYVAEMTPAQMSLEQYFLDVTDEAAS